MRIVERWKIVKNSLLFIQLEWLEACRYHAAHVKNDCGQEVEIDDLNLLPDDRLGKIQAWHGYAPISLRPDGAGYSKGTNEHWDGPIDKWERMLEAAKKVDVVATAELRVTEALLKGGK